MHACTASPQNALANRVARASSTITILRSLRESDREKIDELRTQLVAVRSLYYAALGSDFAKTFISGIDMHAIEAAIDNASD